MYILSYILHNVGNDKKPNVFIWDFGLGESNGTLADLEHRGIIRRSVELFATCGNTFIDP
jgi:hypothetical protein